MKHGIRALYRAAFGRKGRFRWLARVSCLGALLLVFGTVLVGAEEPAEAPSKEPRPIQWMLESSHAALTPDENHFYVRIRVQAPESQTEGRPPLNLALVFDRSNSMDAESKIGYVRRAGHLVVDNLTPQDHVALVAYSHEVQTLAPLHPVVNREYLHHRIDELFADGWTNISGGLLEGCAQLDKRVKQPGRRHAILLTDGVANRGVTDPDELVALVQGCAQRGITISTVGVGADFNEELLARMARVGRGRYTYVAEPEKIPAALKEELGALLPIMAQNARLETKLPTGIAVSRVFGRDEPLRSESFTLSLDDLASGEERVVLVRFSADPEVAKSGELITMRAVLTYDDIRQARRQVVEQTLTLARAAAGKADRHSTPVLPYARLVEAVDKLAQAVNGMDRDLAAEIDEFWRTQYPELKQAAWASQDQDFVNKAFMFEHYARELQDLIERGALHEHSEERARLQKELHYRRYLMEHHRHHHP